MRRALLGLERAAEASSAERDRDRPLLREAFLAWGGVHSDSRRKKEGRAREAGERDRYADVFCFTVVGTVRRKEVGSGASVEETFEQRGWGWVRFSLGFHNKETPATLSIHVR